MLNNKIIFLIKASFLEKKTKKMDEFVKQVKAKARKHKVSEEELEYTVELLSTNKASLVFTWMQFKIFAQCLSHWKSGYFSVYPKNHGIMMGDAFKLELVGVSPTFPYYKPTFGPADDFGKALNILSRDHGSLVLIRQIDEVGTVFSSLGAPDHVAPFFKGQPYDDKTARNMETLEKTLERCNLANVVKLVHLVKEGVLLRQDLYTLYSDIFE